MMPTAEPTGLPSQAPTSFCEACAASCHGGFAAKLGAGHRMTIIGDQAKVYDTTDTTAQLPDLPGANDRSTPANFVLLQPHNQSTPYEFEYEGVEYKFVDPVVVVYSSDVTMVGSATSEGGGTLTVGGFEITQINYDFTFSTVGMEKTDASDPISDTPAPPSTSVSTFGAIKNARYQYTIVKNVQTSSAFRVLTGKMENLLLSASVGGSQYLNGFRAYTATIPATNDAYCDNQDAPTSPVGYLEDPTLNIFQNSYFDNTPDAITTDYEALLAANGWIPNGTVIPQGPASCFDNTFVRVSRRETSDVCDTNGVQMDEAQDQCVGAIAWLVEADANYEPELMIAACVHDYCSFGGGLASLQILHHYQVESFAQRKIDPDILNSATAAAEATVEVIVSEIKQKASLIMDTELAATIVAEVPKQFKLGWAKATGCVDNDDGTETCKLTITVGDIDYFLQGVTVNAVAEAITVGRRDRRASVEVSIEFTALMPVAIATAVQDSGAVVTVATLGAAIGKVIDSDPAAFAAAYPAANQAYEEEGSFVFQAITVAATTTLTFAGGSVSPTSAPETHESELDLYLLVVGLVGGVAIIALIVLTVVKCQLSKPVAQRKPQNDESRVEVGLQPSTDTTAGSEPAKGFELTQVPTEQI